MKRSLEALVDADKALRGTLLRITKSENLTISEWQLLRQVNADITTQEALSEATNLDTSTLSRQLKGLLTKEMISKVAIGRDKRQLIYSMTEQGVTTLERIESAYNTLSDQIFDHWTEEEQNLLHILINRLDKSAGRVFSESR